MYKLMDVANTKRILDRLEINRQNNKYIVLSKQDKAIIHQYYKNKLKIPTEPQPNLSGVYFKTSNKLIANRYNRVVIGDHGAYMEINREDINMAILKLKKKQEWRDTVRLKNPYLKYVWFVGPNDEKVYEQLRTVKYADYVAGKYYLDPDSIIIKNNVV